MQRFGVCFWRQRFDFSKGRHKSSLTLARIVDVLRVAAPQGSGRNGSLGYMEERLLEVSKRHQASSVVRRDDHWIDVETAGTGGASQRVDSGDGGGDVIMRWGLPSNASRAQDRQDDSTPVELEIRFHSVTVAVDMDRQDDSTPVELEIRFHSVTVAVDMGAGRYDSLGYLGERVNPGSSHVHGASQRVDSGDGGGDVIMRWGLPSNASRAQDRQDDSTPVELEIRFHSVTVAVDMELEVRDSEQACSVVRRSCHYMSRLGFGYTVQRGASQRVDSGDGGGDVIMRWGLPSNASRAQDRQDDSTPVELEIRFHSVTVAVDMELEVRDSEQACSVVRRSCHYMSRLGFGYTVQRGASQRVDSGDGGSDVIMRWGLPSNASRAQDRQDDSTPVELEIRFHSVTVAVDMELEVRDSEQACSVVRRSCHYMSRLGFGYTVQRGASQRVDSGDGGGDVIMRWGLPSNASRAQDRQDDSTPVELEIRFHSVTVAVDMELEVRDSEQACSVVRRSCHYMSRLGFGYTVQRGASQRVDSGDGGGDVIMRWGLPSNASRAQDRQDDSTPVELEIRFHSVTVAVDMELEVRDSEQACSVVRRSCHYMSRLGFGYTVQRGASQRVDSGDGGGDVIMRWGLPSNASRAQDRQDDSTPVELEIRFHSVTVAVDMGAGRYDSLGYLGERVNPGSSHVHGASQRVDSGDGGSDVIMRWGLPSNASRAQDRQDDSTPVELEIRFHSVTVAVDMELEVRDSEQACSVVRRSCHYMSRLGFGYTVQRGASQRVDSGDGGGDVIMRWGLPSNASRAQDRQDDSTPVELEIRFHSVTVAVDMELEVRDSEQACSVVRRSCHYMSRLGFGYTVQRGASQRVDSGDGGGDVIMRWGLPSNASRAQDRQDDSTPVELEIRFHSVTVAVDMELEVRDSEQACSVVRRSCHYMSRLGFGYTVQRGASQRVDSGDGGSDVIMRWGLPSNASRAQDRQDDSTPVELEIRFHSVTVAVDMELEVRDSEQACSVVRRSCHYMSRLGFGYTVQRGASQRVDSGDGGGDVIMRWGLPSNASRAQDRQDDSTPVELEIRFHSVTVAVDMELEVRDSEQACSVVRRSCHYMSRLGFGYTVQRGASQRVDSGDGGGDVIMRWGLPSNASRAQDRQDDSTTVELEIRFHSVTVAVDMELEDRQDDSSTVELEIRFHSVTVAVDMVRGGRGPRRVGAYDSLCADTGMGASQRVDSGDGGGDVIMRWGLPSNASRAQDRQDDSTPVELEIRFHSVTVAVDMNVAACIGSGEGGGDAIMRWSLASNAPRAQNRQDDSFTVELEIRFHSVTVAVDMNVAACIGSGEGGGDAIMRWGLPSNASRAQDRQDDSSTVELEIRFHSVTVAVDMDRQDDSSTVELEIRFHSVTVAVDMNVAACIGSGEGGGDAIMRWGLPSNASRAQDRQDDSSTVELEIRFHSVTVAVDMNVAACIGSGEGGGDAIMRWSVASNASHAQDRQDDSTPVELEIRFHSVTVAVDMNVAACIGSGEGGGDAIMRWGLPSNASRAQDRQDDSSTVELEIRFHSVTVAVDMNVAACIGSGEGGGDAIMRWGLPSNASRAQDRQDDSSTVELEIRFHSVTVAVDMNVAACIGSGEGGGDAIMRWSVASNASRAQDRQDDSTPVELEIRFHSVTVAVDMNVAACIGSGEGGGDAIMRWGLPSNASRAQDRQDDSSTVELEIRFHSVTVAVDMNVAACIGSGEGGGDAIMRWGLPSNASRAQDRQDDSSTVELEIRFHSVTVAVDMESGRYDSLGYLGEGVNPGSSDAHGASQRVDSGDGGGDVIMRWGLPSNASRAQDRQDDSTPVELEIRFHSVTVAVDMGSGRYDRLGCQEDCVKGAFTHVDSQWIRGSAAADNRSRSGGGSEDGYRVSERLEVQFESGTMCGRVACGGATGVGTDRQDDSTPVELEIRFHSVTVAVDMNVAACIGSGEGGGDAIMRWGLPSNASRAQDRQDDSSTVELEIRFHSVTVAVDMNVAACIGSGEGGGDAIMRWGLPSNASRAQDRQDDSSTVELEIRFHSVTVAVDMGSGRYDRLGCQEDRVKGAFTHVDGEWI
ncbi:hypothetical protein TGRH88_084320 [Toxoplasma gondii]|uniref:Uncharacterized protein n=1 Tax=Toxoplasma gondii TaxID=5811 RepID=A0A7J6KG14_TOXGO|nr:hypothetical protein TGRH88_084320 [Toxoplasma gondii]